MRLNPFTMWWEHRKQRQSIIGLAETIGADMNKLRKELMEHQAMVGRELNELKYGKPAAPSTLGEPLTPEQEEIIKEFRKNNNLPEQIRRHFARGGAFNRSAVGRFGEAPSEQFRRTDQVDPAVYAYDADEPATQEVKVEITAPPDLNYSDLRRMIAEMPLSQKLRRDDYPGHCYKFPHLEVPPLSEATGVRDPQPPKFSELGRRAEELHLQALTSGMPPAGLEEISRTMDEIERADNAMRDQMAQDQADLDEMDKPKE